DPGYSGARGALLAAGAKLVAVPIDEEGLDVAAGRQLCPEARLAIVTPSHQFPTGVTMCLLYKERRNALVDALTRDLGNRLDVTVPEAGMHLVVWLPSGM